jgi:hypothetical protein
MAFTGIMVTEAQIDQKTGAGVSASWTDTMKTQAVLQAENLVNVTARYNFSDVWAGTLNADVKSFLTEIVASLVAIEGVAYDMSGYSSRVEAESKVNILRDAALRGLALLRDKKVVDFINGA